MGNTPAICLTENLPPERKADVLLIGCGDPRHIIYTVYAEATSSTAGHRELDVTCCDVEGAVLGMLLTTSTAILANNTSTARNTLLFTLLMDADPEKGLSKIWNIFYHMMLDKDSLSLLIKQCKKLVPLAKSMESWKQGPYSRTIIMCSDYTLSELRRFWNLWLETTRYDAEQTKRFKANFRGGMQKALQASHVNYAISTSRAAGPLASCALQTVLDQFKAYWASGVTDSGARNANKADNINPTFAFTSFCDGFTLDCGMDPISGFHLAEVFVRHGPRSLDPVAVSVPELVSAVQNQFYAWCKSFMTRIRNTSTLSGSLVVRMCAGDALAFCQALRLVATGSAPSTPLVTTPWRCSVVQLDSTLYGQRAPRPAPVSFNVIETSNLMDHVGLINILIATVPLLRDSPSSTLYTESLLPMGDSVTRGILEYLCGDPSTMALLLGVIPSTYVSRFATRSNGQEFTTHDLGRMSNQSIYVPLKQYQERLAWKLVRTITSKRISFPPDQLAKVLLDIYTNVFTHEHIGKMREFSSLSPDLRLRRLSSAERLHYNRRTFPLLLSLVRSRVQTDWNDVMRMFDALLRNDPNLGFGLVYYREMLTHLYLEEIFTHDWIFGLHELHEMNKPKIFRSWSRVPPVVNVVLIIPRHIVEKIQSNLSEAGNPVLQCTLRTKFSEPVFGCVTASFGTINVNGHGENKTASITEDSAGLYGKSPMIVSFYAPSASFMHSDTSADVFLGLHPTFAARHRQDFQLFNAALTDETCVQVLAQCPMPANASPVATSSVGPSDQVNMGQIISAQMDKSCLRIQSLTARVDISDPVGQTALASGATVTVEQVTLDQIRMNISRYQHLVDFPLPVDVTNAKLRVARKSKYVEVVAPMSLTLDVKAERSIAKRFTAVLEDGIPTLLNMHHLNLECCPPFRLSKDLNVSKWFSQHVVFMFSERERRARETNVQGALLEDTLLNTKSSILALLNTVGSGGCEPRSAFALWDVTTKRPYVFIFITALCFDLASHTVVADSWIVPVNVLQKVTHAWVLSQVCHIGVDAKEVEAWRHLLPLLIERCRTWEHKENCEYISQNSIPLFLDAGPDPDKVPYCSCGVGIGTGNLRKRYGEIAAYATRAAISPLFAVSYLENVSMPKLLPSSPIYRELSETFELGCRVCGKEDGKLLAEYNRAAKSELSSDFSTAFRLYLSAADSFLHLTRSEPLNPAFHARCKAQAAKSLERAEKIKKASERPGAGIEIDVVPVDWFAQEQQHYVLRKSSVINGIRYPIWTDAVPNADIPVGVLYSDPDGQPAIPSYATSSTNAIDDTLPFDRNGNPVGISTSVKGVLWPALIEKGYMKLMGGYDFPGSNSAIDMHALTGWIPEFIDLQSTSFERERTWTRIMNGFRNGHCVLTVGTDSKTTRKIRGVHLLPSHNYAVISVREYLGERWITLLDSRIPVQGSPTHEDYLRNLDMRWDDLCATFEGVYVSWDPRLFHKELSFHGIWKPRNAEDKEQCTQSKPESHPKPSNAFANATPYDADPSTQRSIAEPYRK
ncbi:hypothetical protein ID866_3268 [Astraeus odoratus]|nr:hypothetical protein ID866_3268 [Astraeus odoratus]